MDARLPETRDLPALAREQVKFGPPPAWVTPCPYDPEFKAHLRAPITHLLREFQVHAEYRQTYVRIALRLETMQAVQENSQWRLELEPQTQSLTLHSIKIRRGALETEHVSLSRMQFLQRESNLEGYTIDGWITLLLLLEDVQPGDVLEWSYTIEQRPRLLPHNTALLFSLPPGVEIGKYHFSVQHAETRRLKWKSSASELAPTITHSDQQVGWVWTGEKFCSPEPEPCTPEWCMDFPWIQISDCPDWQTIACGFLEAWKDDDAGEGLRRLIAEVEEIGADALKRVEAAVQLVQDRFRYLSVDLELGGQIPSPPETVIRRRYGDCKDLSFLLIQLLNGLGITARPVLVNTVARQALEALLPAPRFNHVVVEFEVGNEKRWVDVTAKSQGGAALQRSITNFGVGLPIAPGTINLMPVPAASLVSSYYEVKESFLLDTTGKPSYVAIVVTAKGGYADAFRFEFENSGFDVVARNRLQLCADRYFKATRVGPLQTRDDRELNEFTLGEVFEIEGFLRQDEVEDTCLFQVQSDAAAGLLCPPLAPRRNPFTLPVVGHRVHIIEIEFTGLPAVSIPAYQADAEFFSFSRRCKGLQKYLKLTFSFNRLAESIPPAKLPAHRSVVEAVYRASLIQIRLPVGYARLRKRSDFGALPLPTRQGSTVREISPPASAPVIVANVPAAVEANTAAVTPPVPAIAKPADRAEKKVFIDPVEAATTQRVRSRSGQKRRSRNFLEHHLQRTNRKCVSALLILLGAISALVVGVIVTKHTRLAVLGGLLFLTVIPAWIWSMVLAVLGLRQCLRHAERYSKGKTFAILTLAFGSFIGLLLVPGLIGGIKGAMAANQARSRFGREGQGAFAELNFNFNAPRGWKLWEKRTTMQGVVLAFGNENSPMILNLSAQALPPGLLDPRRHVMELSREAYQREATSYRLISEGEIIRNGLAGWQAETQGIVQGRDCYHVRWIVATNGFGYQIMVFGPSANANQIKEGAEAAFQNFELIQR